MLRQDFYKWRYDDEVPAFLTTGTRFVVYRKDHFDLIDIDTLIEQCAQQGYNLAAPEIGEAPSWWADDNAPPEGFEWAPGYGGGTDPEAPAPPINIVPPTLGQTYTGFDAYVQDGVWYGVPAPTLTYAWYVNDVLDPAQTGPTYPSVVEGSTYRCEVTATNPSGSVTVSTNTITATAAPKLPWDTGGLTYVGPGNLMHSYAHRDTLDSHPNWSDIIVASNYETEDATATSVEIQVNGVAQTGTFVLSGGERVRAVTDLGSLNIDLAVTMPAKPTITITPPSATVPEGTTGTVATVATTGVGVVVTETSDPDDMFELDGSNLDFSKPAEVGSFAASYRATDEVGQTADATFRLTGTLVVNIDLSLVAYNEGGGGLPDTLEIDVDYNGNDTLDIALVTTSSATPNDKQDIIDGSGGTIIQQQVIQDWDEDVVYDLRGFTVDTGVTHMQAVAYGRNNGGSSDVEVIATSGDLDFDPPVFDSAEVGSVGTTTLVLTGSKPLVVDPDGTLEANQFTLTGNTVTDAQVVGGLVHLTLDTEVDSNDDYTGDFSYNGTSLVDDKGNRLQPFTNEDVTNNVQPPENMIVVIETMTDGSGMLVNYAAAMRQDIVPAIDALSDITQGLVSHDVTFVQWNSTTQAQFDVTPNFIADGPDATEPGAPTGLTVTPGDTVNNLVWVAPADDGGSSILDYVIEQSADGSTGWSTITDGINTDTSFQHTGLTNGVEVFYRVSATNSIGTGNPSNVDSGTPVPGATVPDAPTGLVVTAGDTVNNLTWNAPANDGGSALTDYVIEQSPNGTDTWSVVSDGVDTDTTFQHTGLTNDVEVFYRVSAVNAVGTGAPSNVDSGTPTAPVDDVVTFTAPDGTDLVGFTGEDGFEFSAFAQTTMTSHPTIQGNTVLSAQTGDLNGYYGQAGRTPSADVEVFADILVEVQRSGEAAGIALHDVANDCRYVVRYSSTQNQWQVYRFGVDTTFLLWSTSAPFSPSDGNKRLRLSIEGDLLTAEVEGFTVTGSPFDISGDSWESGVGNLYFRDANGTPGEGLALDNFFTANVQQPPADAWTAMETALAGSGYVAMRASDLTKQWTDTIGGTQAQVGDSIAVVEDTGEAGQNASGPVTVADRPLLQQEGSIYYWQFDIDRDVMFLDNFASYADRGDCRVFAVFSRDAASTAAVLWGKGDTGTHLFGRYDEGGSGTVDNNAGSISWHIDDSADITDRGAAAIQMPTDTYLLHEWRSADLSTWDDLYFATYRYAAANYTQKAAGRLVAMVIVNEADGATHAETIRAALEAEYSNPFSPGDLIDSQANSSFWIEPDVGATVFNDAGTTPASPGESVQQINSAGTGVNLTQSTLSKRPLYTAGQGLDYDGTGDALISSLTTRGSGAYLAFVVETTETEDTVIFTPDSAASTARVWLHTDSSNELYRVVRGLPVDFVMVDGSAIINRRLVASSAISSGDKTLVEIFGLDLSPASFATMYLGDFPSITGFSFDGTVYDVALLGDGATTQNVIDIRNVLNTKHSLGLSVPSLNGNGRFDVTSEGVGDDFFTVGGLTATQATEQTMSSVSTGTAGSGDRLIIGVVAVDTDIDPNVEDFQTEPPYNIFVNGVEAAIVDNTIAAAGAVFSCFAVLDSDSVGGSLDVRMVRTQPDSTLLDVACKFWRASGRGVITGARDSGASVNSVSATLDTVANGALIGVSLSNNSGTISWDGNSESINEDIRTDEIFTVFEDLSTSGGQVTKTVTSTSSAPGMTLSLLSIK